MDHLLGNIKEVLEKRVNKPDSKNAEWSRFLEKIGGKNDRGAISREENLGQKKIYHLLSENVTFPTCARWISEC